MPANTAARIRSRIEAYAADPDVQERISGHRPTLTAGTSLHPVTLPEIGVAPHPGDRDRDLVTHRALQDLVAILCGPNHVMPMVKCASRG